MANEKKTELEQLQEEHAAALKTIKELEAVVNDQSAELEKLGAEKAAKAPIIVYKKKKYAVKVASALLKIDGQMKKLQLVDASGNKSIEDADLDALLKVEGQKVLVQV